jgi:hypothetical protein
VAGSDPWSPVRLVIDQESAVQSALGIREPSDDVETAVRIRAGTVVARADGRGAGYAASTYVGQMSK